MSRLNRWQSIWLVLLLPITLGCLGLTVFQVASGRVGFVRLTVTAPTSPEGFPRVRTLLDEQVADQSGLEPGDVLLRAGDTSLRGVGPMTFFANTLAAAPPDRLVLIEFERAGERRITTLDVTPLQGHNVLGRLPLVVAMIVIGPLILLRAPRDRRATWVFLLCMVYSLNQTWFPGGPAWITYSWFVIFALGQFFFAPILLGCAVRWINRPIARWEKLWPWVAFCAMPFLRWNTLTEVALPADLAMRAFVTLDALMLVGLIAYVVYDLRIGDALEFRQSLWVGFGVAVAAFAAIVANVLVAADPSWLWLRPWLQTSTLFVPVCAVLAIVRYDLFDINRLISASASYTLVIGLAVGTFVLLVPYAASAASEVLGTRATFAQAFLSVTLGLVAVQGGRWLHPLLDGWFFPERRALEVGVRRILGTISGHQTAQELAVHVVEPLYELIRPESFVLYVRVGEGYAPVLVRGGVSAPIFESDHPVIFTLKERREPLAERSRARRRLEKELSPIERAVLDTVGASVLVPLHGPDGLFGFTCIGPKRSGDIYTATDLTLLNAVAERLESALLYRGEAERSREGRALQDRLSEYVPKEVADQLQRGEEMSPIHQELSVLFVDIRGYVGLSQSRSPEEVFELINAYTSAVSNVVRGNGGTVVEFRGDGLLAVFGAPEEMAEKEAAAVVAGREILALVGRARFGDLRPGDLRVGVGVATGDAYVGSLESAGQKVWSVLGYIVNLAARLEALTRTLPAAMVIDESTRAPLGETTASGFRRCPSTQIKGNPEPITVHALPLGNEVPRIMEDSQRDAVVG